MSVNPNDNAPIDATKVIQKYQELLKDSQFTIVALQIQLEDMIAKQNQPAINAAEQTAQPQIIEGN